MRLVNTEAATTIIIMRSKRLVSRKAVMPGEMSMATTSTTPATCMAVMMVSASRVSRL